MENWDNTIVKLNKIIGMVSFFLFTIGSLLFSTFLIVAYGLPLNGFKKNQNLVNFGFFILGILIFSYLFWKGINTLLTYVKKRQGKLTIEMKPEKWPSPQKRLHTTL